MAATRRKSSIVATGTWKANKPHLIQRPSVSSGEYPRASHSFIGSIHDARRACGLLDNEQNFAADTNIEVYQATLTEGLKRYTLDDTSSFAYLEKLRMKKSSDDAETHVLVVHLEPAPDTSFHNRVSMNVRFAKQLLSTLDVTPQFIGALLGEPDYGAPGDFASYGQDGAIQRIEFCCQQPRWAIHRKSAPWCVYMTHSFATSSTIYILVCDAEQSRLDIVKERLSDILVADRKIWNVISDSINPFFLHLLITHEVFLDAVPQVTALRHQLYSALDRVDRYAETDAGGRLRSELEELTIQLHIVSQETDRMSANVSMSSMVVSRLIRAHKRYETYVQEASKKDSLVKADDALHFLLESVESQQRWLNSYKARKDIAMNLVFNLVTQQDSATGTTIAREAKADGSSMRVIATLTMVFLPGTFMSSVFGMAVLDHARWWLYVALTLPLTLLVIGIWLVWQNFDNLARLQWRFWRTKKPLQKHSAA